MYNCNTDSLGLILVVEVFFSEGHCSGALCAHCGFNEKQKKYDVGHCQSSEAPVRSHSGVTLVSELISGIRAEQTEESHSEVG